MKPSKFPTFRELSTDVGIDTHCNTPRIHTTTRARSYRNLHPNISKSISSYESLPLLSNKHNTFKFRFQNYKPKRSPSQPFLCETSDKIWKFSSAKIKGSTSPKPPTAGGFFFKRYDLLTTRTQKLEPKKETIRYR